jgi:hypothetical protein
MIAPNLKALETLTRDYATFQTRKSGLATALGGLLAMLLVLAALSPNYMGASLANRLLVEYLVWVPFLWLALKGIGNRLLYRDLGMVKALPDAAYQRRLWMWVLGLALFLIVVLLTALHAFASGFLQGNLPRPRLRPFSSWILIMPALYLLPMPWLIRGIEEARVYAVLVGQCILWLIPIFLFNFGPRVPPQSSGWGRFGDLAGIGLVVLILMVLVWGALAMIRGWREHREYLALLRKLEPGEERVNAHPA